MHSLRLKTIKIIKMMMMKRKSRRKPISKGRNVKHANSKPSKMLVRHL
jgi:hypothetical protein